MPMMLHNGRNTTLPSEDFVNVTVSTLHEQFDSFFHSSDGQLVFPPAMIKEILIKVSRRIHL